MKLKKTACLLFILYLSNFFIVSVSYGQTPLSIYDITDNRNSDYQASNGQIPKYEKLEITFQVNTTASNPQLPYDSNPPPGIDPQNNPNYDGITVNGIFIDPNGKIYLQPAFYYQKFIDEIKNNREWFYPTNDFLWKIRFSPNKIGNWRYKIQVQDKSICVYGVGICNNWVESPEVSFSVIESNNKGFIRVSSRDQRYFEYENGDYFPALGYNMNFDRVAWDNTTLRNQANFQIMGQNGIQLIRLWLSQWSIFASQDNPWRCAGGSSGCDGLTFDQAYPGSEFSFKLSFPDQPTLMLGWMKETPAVKPNTTYHVSIRYLIPMPLSGPRIAGYPYGLVTKIGGWLGDNYDSSRQHEADSDPCPYLATYAPSYAWCQELPASNPIFITQSPINQQGNPQWSTFTATIQTNSTANFLDNFFISLQNINPSGGGTVAYIDEVQIREDLGNGRLGPNIISKPRPAQHQYFDQKYSYAFDKVINLAKQNGIYFKLVVLEKNEFIQNHLDHSGNIVANGNNNNFYGYYYTKTKNRWLQRAYWRYLQARWGYSPQIHSWELLNEGDPYNGLHYTQADDFGKYMHCEVFGQAVPDTNNSGDAFGDRCLSTGFDHPNDHLITTSFWHSFPLGFWNNPLYPNLDYADVHQYIIGIRNTDGSISVSPINLRVDVPNLGSSIRILDPSDYFDSALATQKISNLIGAKQQYGVGKPVMRGETGWVVNNTDGVISDVFYDTQGIWLHKYLWGQINTGGLIESYWYDNTHIYNNNPVAVPPNMINASGQSVRFPTFDYRNKFGNFYRFISTIPLSNGNYQDVGAITSNPDLIVWGQKDLINGRAHLWINNKNHNWRNIILNVNIAPISGTVIINGFLPNKLYSIEQWDTYSGTATTNPTLPTQLTTDNSGNLIINVNNLTTDFAVKISQANCTPTGNVDCQGGVTIEDFRLVSRQYSSHNYQVGDLNNNNKIESIDLTTIVLNLTPLSP